MLILFLRQISVSECGKIFDTLAGQLFPQSANQTSIFSRLHRLLRSWYHDGCHDANILEAYLKENLGVNHRLFGHFQGLTTTKIGVTVATIDNGFPIVLTNYNGAGRWEGKCGTGSPRVLFCKWLSDSILGYKIIRPEEIEDEPYIWQA